MFKKSFLLGLLLIFTFLVSGCTIAKGASGLAKGVCEGAKEDWVVINKADVWVKDNLW